MSLRDIVRRGFLLGILAAVLVSVPTAYGSEGYRYPLFDGKTLDGWVIENDCQVSATDGMLLLESGNGWLRTKQTYTDFKLHVEWRALASSEYDAGIYLRAIPGGKPFPKLGYQVNLKEGREGNIAQLPGAQSNGLAKGAGEWNAFDITVSGETVQTVINGKKAYAVKGMSIPTGFIGFQVEVPEGGQFHLRNIRVTELRYQSLFNGRDFSFWEGAGQPAERCWQVDAGVLKGLKTKGPWLRSQQTYEDFNLRLAYRVEAGANSGVYVRVPADGNHHRDDLGQAAAGFEVQILDDDAQKYEKLKDYQYSGSVYDLAGSSQHVGRPAGEWNTLEINCIGDHVTTIHNGVMIVDVTPKKHPLLELRQRKGFLGLQNHGGGVSFRDLRVGPPVEHYPVLTDAKGSR